MRLQRYDIFLLQPNLFPYFYDTYNHLIAQPLVNVNAKEDGFCINTFIVDQWNAMEAVGAIFLPAAGYHNSTTIASYDAEGEYWSSTDDGDGKAIRLEFTSS